MDYRLDEPFNPDNEDAPEPESATCTACGCEIYDIDVNDVEPYMGGIYHSDCFDVLPEIVALAQSDVDYDRSCEQ